MHSLFQQFKNLHHADKLFILPNAWDAKSAQSCAEQGYAAVGTSSAAVAASLGYEDGEGMPFDEYLFVLKRILSVIQVPLTVDMEMGYGKSKEQVYSNMLQLVNIGVAGINLEDSLVTANGRVLKDPEPFAATVRFIKEKLSATGLELFINIRCDTYILNTDNKREATRKRLACYADTGADGIFLPCICAEDDMADAVQHTSLPVNLMSVPGLPSLDRLNQLGIKRVSMGPFLFNKAFTEVSRFTKAIREKQDINILFS